MHIKLNSYCVITVHQGDAISNVTVIDGGNMKEDQLGCKVDHDGIPRYVCTKLILDGGIANNVRIQNGGEVYAKEGSMMDVDLQQGGKLTVLNADVMGVLESGGYARMEDEGTGNITYMGDIGVSIIDSLATLHKGSIIRSCSLLKGANLIVCGGSFIDGRICSGARLCANEGSEIKNVVVKGGKATLDVTGAKLENVTVESGFINLYYINMLVVKKVVVKKEAVIHRHNMECGYMPSLENFDIEEGTKIIDHYDDGCNGLFDNTIVYEKGMDMSGHNIVMAQTATKVCPSPVREAPLNYGVK